MVLCADVSPFADALNVILVAAAGVVATVITVAGQALVAYIRARTKAGATQDALVLASGAAERGALVAWETYTKAIKAARADGKLTEAEAKEARFRAMEAALESLGAQGRELVEAGLGEDWREAVRSMLEAGYSEVKPNGEVPAALAKMMIGAIVPPEAKE